MKKYLVFLFIIIASWSCKKEDLPETVVGTPVFYINGAVNQDDILYEAGKMGYFMETDFTTTDSSVEMTGSLMDLNEGENKPYVEFLFSYPGDASSFVLDSALSVGSFNFHYPSVKIEGHQVNFSSSVQNPATDLTYSWDFGDGSTSTEVNPQHFYSFEPNVLKYNVCLTVISNSTGCTSNICSDVVFPSYPCASTFSYFNSGFNYVYRGRALRGLAPFTYKWTFENLEAPINTQNVDYNYVNFPDGGVDQVCLELTDAAGRAATYCENITIDTLSKCIVNYTYNATPTTVNTSKNSFVIVKYHDGKGGIYSSDIDQQAANSFFKVNSSQQYLADRKGNATQSMGIEFECSLKKDNESLLLKVSDGVIAVAHP